MGNTIQSHKHCKKCGKVIKEPDFIYGTYELYQLYLIPLCESCAIKSVLKRINK